MVHHSFLVDANGDDLPRSKTNLQLYPLKNTLARTSTFYAILQPQWNNSYEIHAVYDGNLCLGPDVSARSQMKDGVSAVLKRDCTNTLNHLIDQNRLRVNNTNFCLDIPGNDAKSRAPLKYWSCNESDAQKIGIKGGNSNVITPAKPVASDSNRVVKTWCEYEYWIVVDKNYSASIGMFGHAFVSLIKKDFSQRASGAISDTGWFAWKSFGFYGNCNEVGLLRNEPYEMKSVNDILKGVVTGKFTVRKARIGQNRANWIAENYNLAGCASNEYSLYGKGTSCNCASFATRHWYYFTSKWDDFRPAIFTGRSPEDLSEAIKVVNSISGDFVDGGKKWE